MATGLGDVAIGNRIIANIIETDSINTSEVHYPNSLSFINETTGYTTMEISDEDFALTGKTIYAWGNDLANPGTTTEMFSVGVNSLGNFEIYDLNNGQPRMTINASTGVTTFNPPIGGGSSSTGGVGGLTVYLNNSSYPANNTAPDNTGTLLLTPQNYTTPQTSLDYSFVGSSDNGEIFMGTFTTSVSTVATNLVIPAGFWNLSLYTQLNQTAHQVVAWFKIYYVNSGTEYLIADGTAAKQDLTLDLTTQLNTIDLYVPTTNVIAVTDFIRIKVYVQQPTGNTNGHTISIKFNDTTISHLHTSIVSDQASTIDTTEISSPGTYYPTLVSVGTGNPQGQILYTDTGITFNASTNNLTTTTFTGSLSGTATNSTRVNTTQIITAGTWYPSFVVISSGATAQEVLTDPQINFNSLTATLTCPQFAGNLTGNVTGNASTATNATFATTAGSATVGDTMISQSIPTSSGLVYINLSTPPLTSQSPRYVSASLAYDHDLATVYCANFDGNATTATTASVANQVSPQATPTTTVKYLTFVEDTGTQDLLVDKTLPLTYTPSTGLLSCGPITNTGDIDTTGSITTEGPTAGFYNYDRSATPATFWLNLVPTGATTNIFYYRIPSTLTNLEIFRMTNTGLLSTIGSFANGATGKGLQLGDRATTSAVCWQVYNDTQVLTFANQNNSGSALATKMRINTSGQLDVLGTLASVNYFDRTSANAWAVYSNIDILRFFGGGVSNDHLSINNVGLLTVGHQSDTGCGIILHDRTTANSVQIYSSADALTFVGASGILLTFDSTGIADFSSEVQAGQLTTSYGINLPQTAVAGTRVGGTVTFDNNSLPNVGSSLGKFRFTMAANITGFVFSNFRIYGSYEVHFTGHSTTAYTIAGTGLGANIRTNWTGATSIPANASAVMEVKYNGTYWLCSLIVYA